MVACLLRAAREPHETSFLAGKPKGGTSLVGAGVAWCESILAVPSARLGEKASPPMERVSLLIKH